tara:strand:- start:2250 stop:3119 length:870 start_codon:yes stop_codon:yes gene_type:complete
MRSILVFFLAPIFLNGQSAFISGSDSICDNATIQAEVKVSFNLAAAPYTFVYAMDGVNQPPVTTNLNPYVINTSEDGVYTLTSFSDANVIGSISGSALVTVFESPTAMIHLATDTLSVMYPTANFISHSIGSIISWDWDFGDNTPNKFLPDVSHTYKDSIATYQASLIVLDDNGCKDTTINHIWVKNEFWIYIPNSFTPDYNMINDRFCFEYNGVRESTFLFKVYNFQGKLMFQSTDPSELTCSSGGGWDGSYIDNNTDSDFNTYVYEIYLQDFEGWIHQEYGTINLFR